MPSGTTRAKLNLSLRITGRRGDGYHLLHSLVAFAELGDRLTVAPADRLSLTVTGPFADGLEADDGNLVLRAARILREAAGIDAGAALHLEKELPVASGMGGGSGDAALALVLLRQHWQLTLPDEALSALALRLGADVPVCLQGCAGIMQGIGEVFAPLAPLPEAYALLANPCLALPTAEIFKEYATSGKAFVSPPAAVEAFADYRELVAWLAVQSNDLTDAAQKKMPLLAELLSALAHLPGCGLARMSGSGATCFGLFGRRPAAEEAAAALSRAYPGYWIRAARLS